MDKIENDYRFLIEKTIFILDNLKEENEIIQKEKESFELLDNKILNKYGNNETDCLVFDVRGKKFYIFPKNICNFKNNLFFLILSDPEIDIKNEIFIDRTNENVDIIFDFMKGYSIKEKLNKIKPNEMQNLLIECYYYQIKELIKYIIEYIKTKFKINLEEA